MIHNNTYEFLADVWKLKMKWTIAIEQQRFHTNRLILNMEIPS